ncbi:MAG: hypothetical protein Kow0076_6370 [Francisella sp.]
MEIMHKKYRFIVFSLDKLDLENIKAYRVDAKILKQEYKYCYFFMSKDEISKSINDAKNKAYIHIDTFSSLGRRLDVDNIIMLYNSTPDNILKEQLNELIDARKTVIKTQEKLKLKGVEFAKVFSVRPSDVNIWRNMITKPDTFKLKTMKYILSTKDMQNNSFIKYLMEQAGKGYTVTIINLKNKRPITSYTKKFNNKLDAIDYFEKLKNNNFNFNLEIQLLDHFDNILMK